MCVILWIWAIMAFAAWMEWEHGFGLGYLGLAAFITVVWWLGWGPKLKWLAAIAKVFRFLGM